MGTLVSPTFSLKKQVLPQAGFYLPLGSVALSTYPHGTGLPGWLQLASWDAGHLSLYRLLQAAFNQRTLPAPSRQLGNQEARGCRTCAASLLATPS